MAGNNSNFKITDLDFNTIKNNLKTYLQSQDVLKDYNYDGSALSTLLDILAYNTQYNAYYLNMVANEMFLDSALQRGSVISQAKALNYTPKSSIAPKAIINLKVNQVTEGALTLPKFTTFLSESIDGVNYNFVTTDSYTVNTANNSALFTDVELFQGIPASTSYTVDLNTNPKLIFELPEGNIDTTSLVVTVQQSSSNSYFDVYTLADDFLSIDGTSKVYFLQESRTGTYEIYFGNDVLGKKLVNGNIVRASYVVTQGTSSTGANNFVLMNSVSGYSNTVVYPILAATQGGDKESIESIKFQAPKAFAAQKRAVTKEDYITAIQQNKLGISLDAVSVWGGEQNDPPVFGKVFVSMKPNGGYNLTQIQKQKLITEVIKPISMMTVEPSIVDPDYTYLKLNVNVFYDPKKTTFTPAQISSAVRSAILTYSNTNLNTFNATFSSTELAIAIKSADPSITTNELSVQLQKKFYPELGIPRNYKFYYGSAIKKSNFLSGISSSPSYKVSTASISSTPTRASLIASGQEAIPYAQGVPATEEQVKQAYRDILRREADASGLTFYLSSRWSVEQIRQELLRSEEYANLFNLTTPTIINDVYLEELASSTGGVESISIVNPGYGYQYAPIVTIRGDGVGATAIATIDSTGTIRSIIITNAGSGYTNASVVFTPVSSDTTGQGAVAAVNLQGRYGIIRSYYNDSISGKTIINANAGTIDYEKGLINLIDFSPLDVNNPLGQLTITCEPTTSIVSSSYNRIISIDEFDPTAITINVVAKT